MFFTSGRPTRSILTLNSPRVRVSATAPTSVQPGRRPVSISTTMLSTFLPSRKIDPGSLKASLRVAIVARAARASMMNGSQRTPAKTRIPGAVPPSSSLTRNETSSPAGVRQVPCCSWAGSPVTGSVTCSCVPKTQSMTTSTCPGRNSHRESRPVDGVTDRSRKRYTSPPEKRSDGLAIGNVFMTSTRRPGASGLGNAYTSVMSAIGSARARGPEMWSDISGLVAGLVDQGLHGWMLEDLGGLRMVEHLLERGVHALGLFDLL